MVHRHRMRLSALFAIVLVLGMMVSSAFAAPTNAPAPKKEKDNQGQSDDLASPLAEKQRALRQKALEKVLKGQATPKGKNKVVEVAKGQYVELAREDTDKIFVVLVEFGNEQYTGSAGSTAPAGTFVGPPTDGSTTDVTGPLHNEIPQPDRSVDNSTLWQADYNRAHYENMYFNRMAKYYQSQSSGRYTVEGAVTEWVKVPFNEALYGRNYCGSIVCATSKALVRDALAVWVKAQLDSGMTMPQIQTYLKSFDEWDRYDIDGDGNFDEPDGVIDHFQIVHAGGDEAAGDPNQGSDAIWSHRWFTNLQAGGPYGVGIDIGTRGGLASSTLVPNNSTGVWVYDYTVQPENGGLGVFAHEYGHDLGLPDLYDTSGNTGGAENSTAFWTLMSSGANIGDGSPNGIGDAPTDMGVWEKFQLGWLDAQGGKGPFYQVAFAGQKVDFKLGPNNGATMQAQALFVVLPDKDKQSTIFPPKTGSYAYWSGMGDNLSNTMTRAFTLPAGATISGDIWYDTEAHFDYLFLEVSSDNGTTWTPVMTNISKPASDDDGTFNSSGTGIGGSSGNAYVPFTSTSALPTGNVLVRFRYQTDTNTGGKGGVIDNIAISGNPVDGAEEDTGWTFDGFLRIKDGIGITKHFNAYVGEFRGYRGYDKSLATAYNFGFLDSRPDWVETHPYEDGLLLSYWDTSFTNNNVGDHPGSGLILPIDAHPTFYHSYDGHLLRPRILSYDSTFGLDKTTAITVHKNSQPTSIPSAAAVSVFDDTKTWWFNNDGHGATGSHVGRYQPGWYGVDVPKTGTLIRVKSVSSQGDFMQVEVSPK
jgi:immune inhibitor A